jgi:hydrogenase nickel incorporation protein HypA/HybF
MHELPVTEEILRVALEHAAKAGACRILAIHLTIGQLNTFVDESIQFYWDFIAASTAAEGARLEFQRVPATFSCGDCGSALPTGERFDRCPGCNSRNVELRSGTEFYVQAIEIDTGVCEATT